MPTSLRNDASIFLYNKTILVPIASLKASLRVACKAIAEIISPCAPLLPARVVDFSQLPSSFHLNPRVIDTSQHLLRKSRPIPSRESFPSKILFKGLSFLRHQDIFSFRCEYNCSTISSLVKFLGGNPSRPSPLELSRFSPLQKKSSAATNPCLLSTHHHTVPPIE